MRRPRSDYVNEADTTVVIVINVLASAFAFRSPPALSVQIAAQACARNAALGSAGTPLKPTASHDQTHDHYEQ